MTAPELEQGGRFLRTILDNIPDPVWLKDRSGRFLACNKAFAEFHGCSVETLLGRTVIDVIPQGADRLAQEDERVLGSRKPLRVEQPIPDEKGRTRWFETIKSPIFDESGEVVGTVGIAREITERKQAEEESRAAQQRFGHLLAKSPAIIYSARLQAGEFTISWVSENFSELLGHGLQDPCEWGWWPEHVHPEDREHARISIAQIAERGQTSQEYRILHKNGKYLWVQDEQRLVCDATGQAIEIVGSWTDVTERRHLEAQLRQSQKLEAVGQLASGVAHDFNNMLSVIRGNIELVLTNSAGLSTSVCECLKQAIAATDRAATLTRQLLAFSRKQVLQRKPLNLGEVIGNLTKMLNRIIGEDIQLQCQFATRPLFVEADVGLLEQAIFNLAVNARDAMPRGGRLQITTERACIDETYCRSHPEGRPGHFACLSVSDTGVGIPTESLPLIFEPFFTTKEPGKGTGLGLATVLGIVKQHQGWIEVSSRVDEGTTFKVFLPEVERPTAARAASPAERVGRGGTETILLVEDDQAVRAVTRRILEGAGYRVHEATSGSEALQLWGSRAPRLDLLLTDIVLPGGISGRELAERLRTRRPAVKVIFTSGYSFSETNRDTEFIQRSNSYLLQKPCPSGTLLHMVRRCLDEFRQEQAT